ncbi:bifunctional diguanylate cyclase/phosphodiesterase [Chthonobacter albigriseus]|uniref:bifunctional diguanylate cyclase/phosphodiesterase n=1 Tax=Chthonobacter albigriseus TaxID=1683161 RepID=UPI0015EE6B0B|nr:EAL domain-containing protein [Chthonobacter albigriseus]
MQVRRTDPHSLAHFLVRIAVPVFLTLGLTIGIVFLALHRMGDAVTRIDTEYTARTVSQSLATLLDRLRTTQQDYAIWDDAAENLYGTPDADFVNENIRDSTANENMFDTSLLFDENGRTLFVFHKGVKVEAQAEQLLGPAFGPHLKRVLANKEVLPTAHFGGSHWGLIGYSVGPVLPYDQSVELPEGEKRFLLVGKLLSPEAISELGRTYSVDDLHAVPDRAEAQPGYGVVDADGKVLTHLVWTPREPGTVAFAEASTLALSVTAVLFVLVGFLLAGIYRMLRAIRVGEEKARKDSLHDALTGLANRAAFHADIDVRHLGTAKAQPTIVLFIDLDGFKEVNDIYGHEIGDRLLKAVASGFSRIIGAGGFLARLGGDEFAVILPGTLSDGEAERVGAQLIAFLAHPMEFDGRIIQVGASIGMAGVRDGSINAVELVRRADVAMYAAKEGGKNRLERYDPVLDEERTEQHAIAVALRQSLEDDAFDLVYQPVIDARSGLATSVEALLRWTRPGVGPVPPRDFIPIAEETGVIGQIGEWVLRRACRDARNWPDLNVSVNVSPAQFSDPSFDRQVARILQEERFDPKRLELEITETYLVAHPDRAQRTIEALRALGISVSLDDFGTGFSSIGYLRRFAFDKLKLDRSLITGVATSDTSQRLVHATVAVADALGIRVTAEGIEGEDEAMLLRIAGCQELQGFHFARPKPAREIDAMVQQRGGMSFMVA